MTYSIELGALVRGASRWSRALCRLGVMSFRPRKNIKSAIWRKTEREWEKEREKDHTCWRGKRRRSGHEGDRERRERETCIRKREKENREKAKLKRSVRQYRGKRRKKTTHTQIKNKNKKRSDVELDHTHIERTWPRQSRRVDIVIRPRMYISKGACIIVQSVPQLLPPSTTPSIRLSLCPLISLLASSFVQPYTYVDTSATPTHPLFLHETTFSLSFILPNSLHTVKTYESAMKLIRLYL